MQNNIEFHDEEIIETEKKYSKSSIVAFLLSFIFLLIQIIPTIIGKIKSSSYTYEDIIRNLAEINSQPVTGNSIELGLSAYISIILFILPIIIGAIALKQINKKKLKGNKYAVLGIILPFVFLIVSVAFTILLNYNYIKIQTEINKNCMDAINCKKNEDKTYSCQLDGKEILCPTKDGEVSMNLS